MLLFGVSDSFLRPYPLQARLTGKRNTHLKAKAFSPESCLITEFVKFL